MDARTMRNESLPRWDKMLDEMFAKMKEGGVKKYVFMMDNENTLKL